jgi:hypothetical protein
LNSTQLMKFAAGVLLFGAWLALVVIGKAPADHLIDAIALTIAGLGIHGATMSTPGGAVSAIVPGELQAATAEFAAAPIAAVATPAPAAAPAPVATQVAATAQPTIQ